ncbi:MAG: helix-turn-helix domain-containing protein [Firmicutes bacterium]|nr:helix-turn-helix domain-containing protein [Bacillota bacterium]
MSEFSLAPVLTVEDVQNYLNIGRSSAYWLCTQPDFPAFRIGRQIRVRREEFFQWMDMKKGAVKQ